MERAGDLLREHHERPRNIRLKGRIDLVTETDLAVEAFLRQELGALLPEAGILAEESAIGLDMPPLCWVVDPVDGTTNFAHGLPLVGISVALVHQGEPVLGAVHTPLLGELFHAVAGGGAFLNGRPITVTATEGLGSALGATGFPYEICEELPRLLARLEAFLPRCRGLRRCGAASVDLSWVACGRFDLYFENRLKPWDMAAGVLLVREAGGLVSDFSGGRFKIGRGEILASNGRVHGPCLKLLRGCA